jgi:Ca2+-binding RTX toxin-like protein
MVTRVMNAGLSNWPADYGDNNAGDDTVTGTNDDDRIVGGTGNDNLNGGIGNDIISGGPGSDIIAGGPGNDTIDPGSGNDTVFGGAGDDIISIGEGTDTVFGGDGVDTFVISGTGGGTAVQFSIAMQNDFAEAHDIAEKSYGILDLSEQDNVLFENGGTSPTEEPSDGGTPPTEPSPGDFFFL